MILTKEVEIKVNPKTVKYYESLGYEMPMKKASESSYKKHKKEFIYDFDKTIIVKVEDLTKGSNECIEVVCDLCKQNTMTVPYYRYAKSIEESGYYVCKECTQEKIKHILQEKYNVSNIAQLDWIQEKIRQTNIERYGVPNYTQTKECRDKMKNTMLSKYGVEHNSQMQDYKEKFHNTSIERYGEFYYKYFTEKAFNTFYEKTGYKNPFQSPDVKEKIKQSCLDRYGYECSLQIPEVREKITQSLYANSSQKASKQQKYICNLYQGILNYPIKHYNVDIYLPDDNLVIEYDGSGHMLNVVTGRETMEEHKQKEIIRSSILKREGYKQIRIISLTDKIPLDDVLLQMLSTAKQYFNTTSHTWINFDIDNSIMINAENKNISGVHFDYGELRKIKNAS